MSGPTAISLAEGYKRHLEATNKSRRTIATYEQALVAFSRFLEGRQTATEDIAKGDVETSAVMNETRSVSPHRQNGVSVESKIRSTGDGGFPTEGKR